MKRNVVRQELASSLAKHGKQTKQRVWRDVSEVIAGPRKNRSLVNVGEISRNTSDGAKVIVAGKVLGAGNLDHKVTVAAFSFSEGAKSKISKSGGQCLSLQDFMVQNDSAKGVVILG